MPTLILSLYTCAHTQTPTHTYIYAQHPWWTSVTTLAHHPHHSTSTFLLKKITTDITKSLKNYALQEAPQPYSLKIAWWFLELCKQWCDIFCNPLQPTLTLMAWLDHGLIFACPWHDVWLDTATREITREDSPILKFLSITGKGYVATMTISNCKFLRC